LTVHLRRMLFHFGPENWRLRWRLSGNACPAHLLKTVTPRTARKTLYALIPYRICVDSLPSKLGQRATSIWFCRFCRLTACQPRAILDRNHLMSAIYDIPQAMASNAVKGRGALQEFSYPGVGSIEAACFLVQNATLRLTPGNCLTITRKEMQLWTFGRGAPITHDLVIRNGRIATTAGE